MTLKYRDKKWCFRTNFIINFSKKKKEKKRKVRREKTGKREKGESGVQRRRAHVSEREHVSCELT